MMGSLYYSKVYTYIHDGSSRRLCYGLEVSLMSETSHSSQDPSPPATSEHGNIHQMNKYVSQLSRIFHANIYPIPHHHHLTQTLRRVHEEIQFRISSKVRIYTFEKYSYSKSYLAQKKLKNNHQFIKHLASQISKSSHD